MLSVMIVGALLHILQQPYILSLLPKSVVNCTHHLQPCVMACTVNSPPPFYADQEAAGNSHMVAQHLLLDYLGDRHQQKDAALSASAKSFLTCRMFADELTALRTAGGDPKQQQAQLLARYQSTNDQLQKGVVCELNAGGQLARTSFVRCHTFSRLFVL